MSANETAGRIKLPAITNIKFLKNLFLFILPLEKPSQLRNQEPYAAYNQQVNTIESLPKIVDQILKAGKFESKTLTPEQKLTMGPNILLKDNQLNIGPSDKIDLSAYRRSVKNQQRRNRED